VEQAAKLNQLLNVSIGAFQGLASVALNGMIEVMYKLA